MSPSRYSQVSRRAFLGGASMAAILGLAACGNDSSSSSSATSTSAAPTEAASSATATAAASSTAAASTSSAAATGTLPASAKATVTFTYAASSSGGFVKNPYYAVWVEDSKGNLVKTLLLDHLSGNDRWLNEMTAWYAASGGTDTTTEGTKPAGTYSCTWDGTDTSGNRVAAGTYTICVESNREHGSESLVTSKQVLGSKALSVNMGSNNELTATSLKYTV